MKFKLITLIVILLAFSVAVKAEISVLNTVDSSYNINEKIALQTTITNTKDISGYVKANIDCDNYNLDYYVTPFEFKTTPQQINIPELTLTESMLGKCTLNIILLDLNDSLIDQSLVQLIDVSDKLNLNSLLADYDLDVGQSLIVKGTVTNIRNLPVNDAILTITLEDNNYEYNLDKSDFEITLPLAETIKSGTHEITVNVKDPSGNSAETVLGYTIIPKAMDLKNLVNKLEFLPGESVEISSLLYDQANDLIENDAEIRLYNPDNKYVTQGYGKLIYVLPSYANPGTWIVRTSNKLFNIESKFIVKELKQADIYIEGNTLFVKNTGNVNYQDDITVNAGDQEFTKQVNIPPNEVEKIELNKKLDPGVYDVTVASSSGLKEFPQLNVEKSTDPSYLTGLAVTKTANTLIEKPYLIFTLLALILVTLYLVNRNKTLKRVKHEREIQLGNTQMLKIKKDKGVSFQPKKFSEMNDEELKDYRKQILKNMKDDKKDDENPGYQYKPPKEGKGLFSMFD